VKEEEVQEEEEEKNLKEEEEEEEGGREEAAPVCKFPNERGSFCLCGCARACVRQSEFKNKR
jgi:hypothetical protein